MEKKRKIPQRKCVGCGERRDKGELCRIVKTPDGGVCLDKTGRMARTRRISVPGCEVPARGAQGAPAGDQS